MLTYKGYQISPGGAIRTGLIVTRNGENATPSKGWFSSEETAKEWIDKNGSPVILDPEAMSPFMLKFWGIKANALKGKADYLDPWRKPMSVLRQRLPKGSRVYRAALVGLHGKSEIVTL